VTTVKEIQLLKESNVEYFVGEYFCGLAVFLWKLFVTDIFVCCTLYRNVTCKCICKPSYKFIN